MKELANDEACDGFVADAQHLGSGADGSDVFIAPANLVIETQAGNGGIVGVEAYVLGAGCVVAQTLRERHFHSGNQIDDHPYLLSFSSVCGNKGLTHRNGARERQQQLDVPGHEKFLSSMEAAAMHVTIATVVLTLGERQANSSTGWEFPAAPLSVAARVPAALTLRQSRDPKADRFARSRDVSDGPR
jgi:hypothetical protein